MNNSKWEIIAKTIITWLAFSVLAKIYVIAMQQQYSDYSMIDGQAVVWSWCSLVMGIYLYGKSKKWTELLIGLAMFVATLLPIIGMLIGIAYFAYAHSKLVNYKYGNENNTNLNNESNPSNNNQISKNIKTAIQSIEKNIQKFNSTTIKTTCIYIVGLILIINVYGIDRLSNNLNNINRGSLIFISAITDKPTTINYKDGNSYSGHYSFRGKNGYGEFIFSDGDVYKGEWENDLKEGQGEYFWPDGSHYKGTWINGDRNGYGEFWWSDGSCYKGEWKNDLKEGHGKIFWPNGNINYEGQFVNGSRDGYGIAYSEDGKMFYQGEWKNNNQHGKGVSYYTNGAVYYSGEWVYGNPKTN